MSHLLDLQGVSKRFGGVQAVDSVDFYADPGEIVGVIGPNGAGKTTLFNIVTGFYSPDAGKINFDGHNLVGLKPNQITRVECVRTHAALTAIRSKQHGLVRSQLHERFDLSRGAS